MLSITTRIKIGHIERLTKVRNIFISVKTLLNREIIFLFYFKRKVENLILYYIIFIYHGRRNTAKA